MTMLPDLKVILSKHLRPTRVEEDVQPLPGVPAPPSTPATATTAQVSTDPMDSMDPASRQKYNAAKVQLDQQEENVRKQLDDIKKKRLALDAQYKIAPK